MIKKSKGALLPLLFALGVAALFVTPVLANSWTWDNEQVAGVRRVVRIEDTPGGTNTETLLTRYTAPHALAIEEIRAYVKSGTVTEALDVSIDTAQGYAYKILKAQALDEYGGADSYNTPVVHTGYRLHPTRPLWIERGDVVEFRMSSVNTDIVMAFEIFWTAF